ncbi:hypothetical protein EVAR_64698_1 [Eumeta japonica]|uniref:Uncharacterized protein n=1 Tax=Eumeta variegata TaxID=151549 RepID=A0A4C1SWU9_EUMVA|nr:hypothetical protein EVAR_64698_1 [Eumeta japonica]
MELSRGAPGRVPGGPSQTPPPAAVRPGTRLAVSPAPSEGFRMGAKMQPLFGDSVLARQPAIKEIEVDGRPVSRSDRGRTRSGDGISFRSEARSIDYTDAREPAHTSHSARYIMRWSFVCGIGEGDERKIHRWVDFSGSVKTTCGPPNAPPPLSSGIALGRCLSVDTNYGGELSLFSIEHFHVDYRRVIVVASFENVSRRNAEEKKEGSGCVIPAQYIIRRQFRAAEFRALYRTLIDQQAIQNGRVLCVALYSHDRP